MAIVERSVLVSIAMVTAGKHKALRSSLQETSKTTERLTDRQRIANKHTYLSYLNEIGNCFEPCLLRGPDPCFHASNATPLLAIL